MNSREVASASRPNTLSGDLSFSEGETNVLSGTSQMWMDYDENASPEGETSILSSELPDYSFFEEGETSLLSGMELLNPDANEGETTLLSQKWEDVPEHEAVCLPYLVACEEGETTVLSSGNESSAQHPDISRELTLDGGSEKLTAFYTDENSELETMILTSEPEIPWREQPSQIDGEYRLFLLNNMNGELVPVEVTPFTIGKDRANMDYVYIGSVSEKM